MNAVITILAYTHQPSVFMKLFSFFLIFTISSLFFNECLAQSLILPTPKGWSKETILFPIEFAPNIPYKGVEELRFAPGWSQPESEEYWSYCYSWLIGDQSVVNAELLTTYMKEYYSGLVNRNISQRNIPSSKIIPTVAKITSNVKDGLSFTGTVEMLDYMDEKPMTLNIQIRVKKCPQNRKTAIFFEVSPQSKDHFIWRNFSSIWNGFDCN